MLKANALEKISSDLYNCLESFEYVELCNFLREEIETAKALFPQIHYMERELNDFNNKRSENFDENLRYFIVNENEELESSDYGDDFIDYLDAANIILDNKFETEYKEIDESVKDYWNVYTITKNFLLNLPERTLFIIWNDFQIDTDENNLLYETTYDGYAIAIDKNGKTIFSDQIKELISIDKIIDYYND